MFDDFPVVSNYDKLSAQFDVGRIIKIFLNASVGGIAKVKGAFVFHLSNLKRLCLLNNLITFTNWRQLLDFLCEREKKD